MSIAQRDYILRMIEQLGAALARIAGLKTEGKHDEALAAVRATVDAIFGPLATTLDRLDAASAARMLGGREKLGVYAALLAEEADIAGLSGNGARSRSLYKRALVLQLESLALYTDGAEQTRTAIRALRGKVDETRLDPPYRDALAKLDGA